MNLKESFKSKKLKAKKAKNMNNFIKSHFKDIDFDNALVFLFIALIALIFANNLVNNPGMSITPWFKMLLAMGGVCLVIVLLKGPGILQIFRQTFLERPYISMKTVILIALVSFSIALLLLINTQIYLLLWGFILVTIGLFSFSIYFMLTNNPINSICLYVLCWPFVAFTQSEIRKLLRSGSSVNPELFNLEVFLLVIFVLVWLIKHIFIKKNFKKDIFNLAIFLFAGIAFISVIFSLDASYSMRCYLFQVIYPILIYFVVLNSVKKKKDIKKILLAIAITTVLHLGLGFYYYIKYYSPYNPYILQTYRMVNIRGLIQIAFPITFGLIVMSKNNLFKIIFGIFVVLQLFVLVHTGGRGALLSVALCLLIFLLIKKSRKYALVLLMGTLLFTFLFVSSIKPYWRDLTAFQSIDNFLADSSMQNRLNGWRAGIDMFKDNPINGVGLGMYKKEYFKYGPLIYNPLTKMHDISMVDAHNMFITVLAERGVIGILPVSLLLIVLIQRTIYMLKSSKYNILEITLSLPILLYLYLFSIRGGTLGIFVNYPLDGGLLRWIIFALIIVAGDFNNEPTAKPLPNKNNFRVA